MRWEVWSPYIQESFEPGVKTKSFQRETIQGESAEKLERRWSFWRCQLKTSGSGISWHFTALRNNTDGNTGISWSPMTMSAKENALEPGLAPSVWNTKAVPIRGLPRRGWIYSMPLVWSGMSGSFSGTECTRHWNGICKSMARRGSLSPMSQRRGSSWESG